MIIEKKDDGRLVVHDFVFSVEADKDQFLLDNTEFFEFTQDLPFSKHSKFKLVDNVVVSDDDWNDIIDDVISREASIEALKVTDWKVIRDLEIMYLGGTNLAIERAKLRQATDVRLYKGNKIYGPIDDTEVVEPT